MSGSKRKFEAVLAPDALAGFLKALVADLDAGRILVDGVALDLDQAKSLELTCKRGVSGMKVKLKVKLLGPEGLGAEDEPEEGGAPNKTKYSTLKKWMKKEFKTIQSALAAGTLPTPEVCASFVEDSRAMVTFPGNGDEFYPAYLAQVDAFAAAVAAADLERAKAAVEALAASKRECHTRYK
jgi:XXXCH domain-containing protein